MRREHIVLFLFFLFNSYFLFSQNIVVKGVVYNENTKAPIEFVNVIVPNSTVGTISDIDGKFVFRIPAISKELTFTVIGYKPKTIQLSGNTSHIVVYLEEEVKSLNEVIINVRHSPAVSKVDSVIKYKNKNNPAFNNDYKARVYKKETYLFTGLDSGFRNNMFFRKHPDAFIQYGRGDTVTCFPVYMSEEIVDIYRKDNPYKERKEIIADKKEGVNFITGPEITGLVGTIETNFYSNYIYLLDKDFLSPFANGARLMYNYFMNDTAVVDGDTLFQIRFKPKEFRDLLMIGNFWYNPKNHAVVEVKAEILPQANLNFIKNFRIHKIYQKCGEKYFYGDEKMILDFVYVKKTDTLKQQQTIRLDKSLIYRDVELDTFKIDYFGEQKSTYEIIQKDDAFTKDSAFWSTNRPVAQDSIDIKTENSLKEVNDIGIVKSADWLADMLINGWIRAGFIEIGPWESLIKSNEIEGFRYCFGARLAPKISKRFLVSGFVAYGQDDKKWKFGGALGYTIPSTKYQIVQARYEDNVITMGEYKNNISYIKENMFVRSEDNIFGNLIYREKNTKLYHLKEGEFQYSREWRPGIYTRLLYNYYNHAIPDSIFSATTKTLTNHEITFHVRLSKNETVINNYFHRLYFLTKYPRLHIISTFGYYDFQGQQNKYLHLRSVVEHNYTLGIGRLNYVVEAGHIFGAVPYPLLEIPRGNLSYGYSRYAYNLMNIMEYANDTYLNLLLEYQTNGYFLNRVPLIKYLKLRESFTAKFVLGRTDDRHSQLLEYPEYLSDLNGSYVELGFGVTNLFKWFRVQNSWRLTERDKKGVMKYIVQIGIYWEF